MKNLTLILIILLSSSLRSEMINLECKTQNQNSERINTFSLLLGTETKKAVQILKKGQLTMDLSIQEEYFEVYHCEWSPRILKFCFFGKPESKATVFFSYS